MIVFAETTRLILREILPADAEGIFELESDPDVHRYLGNRPITNKDEIEKVIKFIRKQYMDYGIGRWAVVDKSTNKFIGWAGLRFVTDQTNNHRNFYDISYRLIKKYWKQGFATESATASLVYAFDILNINVVYAMADCENEGSNKILKKLGLALVETFNVEGLKHNWYKIEKIDYENNSLTPNKNPDSFAINI